MSKIHELFDLLTQEFPDIDYPACMDIWKKSSEYLKAGDTETSRRLVKANFFLYNSVVPASAVIGSGTKFSYGGIGVILHERAVIGKRCKIGQGANISGKCRSIGDDVYISAGAKIVGRCRIGSASIIGANAVVMDDVRPLSIVAGVPAKEIGAINRDNIEKYRGYFYCKKSDALLEEFKKRYGLD